MRVGNDSCLAHAPSLRLTSAPTAVLTLHLRWPGRPIEYYHKHKKSTINQREIGVDCPSFKEGIRRGLRMCPDVILVGEMRDLDTIHAAIEAAETGHVVFGTLHTSASTSRSARATPSPSRSRRAGSSMTWSST
jgi:Tfp pilus assembly pilus retraction ATPase PilT